MSVPPWPELEELFHEARARPAAERSGLLAERCAGRPELRAEVEAMLRAHDAQSGWNLSAVPASALLRRGTRLGAYEILGPIGAGGMGEVYRARDSRLRRDVAIKVLPAAFMADTDRLARFEREARVLAALNHPNIAAIYGIEEVPAYADASADKEAGRPVRALVLELVEGDTLADRLARGPLPVTEALGIAKQIADGLDATHQKDIIHRDLKPANIKVTPAGTVKVLDFGLAKAVSPMPAGATGDTPVITIDGTREGILIGTAAYMSPEQARGQTVDKRTDIWAFGCLLYEMLTRRPAFAGETIADTIAAILERDPEWDRLSASTPLVVTQLLRRCLEKDPRQRLRDIGDVRHDLEAAAKGVGKRRAAVAVALLALAIAAIALVFVSREPATPPQLEYTQLTNFADSAVAPALSPDGRMLAFIRGENTFLGPGDVYVKLLPDGEPVRLTHDQMGKMGPIAFSPDGSRLSYSVGINDTWVVPVLGGEPTRLLANAGGLSWIDQDAGARRVMFSALTGKGLHMGIFSSTESRADERAVYLPAEGRGMAHRAYLSPDRSSVLLAEMDMPGWLPCRVVPFDGRSSGKQVGPAPAQCTDAAWSPDGEWMYFSANTGGGYHIWRQPYPDGAPEQVTFGATEEQGIAFAPDGRSFVTSVGERQSTLWVYTSGGDRQVTSQGFAYLPSLSADGSRLYYLQRSRTRLRSVSGELWTTNLQTGNRERLLPDYLVEHYDVSRDGKLIVFSSIDEGGRSSLWLATLDGSAVPRRLASFAHVARALFGPEGDVFFVGDENKTRFLYRIGRDVDGLRQVMATPASYLYAISPDGQWLAVWVQNDASIAIVSTDGASSHVICSRCASSGADDRGVTPPRVRWSRDGQSLYLHSEENRQTYVVRLGRGEMVPKMPDGGFASMQAAIAALGARPIGPERAFIENDTSVYVYPRITTHRNIYRIAVP